jgi:hypothetical protein
MSAGRVILIAAAVCLAPPSPQGERRIPRNK